MKSLPLAWPGLFLLAGCASLSSAPFRGFHQSVEKAQAGLEKIIRQVEKDKKLIRRAAKALDLVTDVLALSRRCLNAKKLGLSCAAPEAPNPT